MLHYFKDILLNVAGLLCITLSCRYFPGVNLGDLSIHLLGCTVGIILIKKGA